MNHDIRTPLNSIITLSGLLVEGNAGPLSVEQVRYLEVIQRSGESLLSLVTTILDLSALEAGRIETDQGPVDLARLLGDLEEECRRRAKSKGLAFHLSLPREPVTVRGDRDRLRQVVVGLVESAIATTSHGYVEVSLVPKDAEAQLQISDTGAGPALVARGQSLDDYLTQLDPLAQHPGEGAPALSVLLASRLLPLMGGALRVDGTPGEGTTYSLVLPAAQTAAKDMGTTRGLDEPRSSLGEDRDRPVERDRERSSHDEPLAGHVLIITMSSSDSACTR
jgi:signal transduction histidine kinase